MLPREQDMKGLLSALRDQTQALRDQTQAMRELVQSNRDLIDCFMTEGLEVVERDEAPRSTYLDGSPI